MTERERCGWSTNTRVMIEYHDREWGVPVHEDRKLFEFLLLDSAQAGLSWSTILNKREGYRRAFDDFDPEKIARYGEEKIQELLANPEIVRNRLKVRGAVQSGRAFLAVRDEFGSFDRYIWRFVDGTPRQNSWRSMAEIPTHTPESDVMSKDLKRRGFTFVGTTICYAFMQGAGLVNDHLVGCFRWEELRAPG
jgi:DNA-3-methyladenine glycosylase I